MYVFRKQSLKLLWAGLVILAALALTACGEEAQTQQQGGNIPDGPTGPVYHIGFDTVITNATGLVSPQIRYIGPYTVNTGTFLTGLGVALATGGFTGANTYKLGLYSDAGNKPGTLLATSAFGTWADAKNNEVTTNALYLAPGDYWVAANAETGTFYVSQGTTAGVSNIRYETAATGWDVWPATATSALGSTFAHHAYMIVQD